jgi:hypothetical protein
MTQLTTSLLRSVAETLEYAWWKNQRFDQKYVEFEPKTEIRKEYKISLCTTCMDRLADLAQTLPYNISVCSDYGNVEFVILDYNSKGPEVRLWMENRWKEEIERGLITFYRTDEPKFYSMSHSRNLAFKLAAGDIVANVDADYFLERSFAKRLAQAANQAKTDKAFFVKSVRSTHGRIAFVKDSFVQILGGYDETFLGYGHDDKDIIYRAWCLGFTLIRMGGADSHRIPTSSKERVKNYDKDGIESNWRFTEQWNKIVSYANLFDGKFKANRGNEWGRGRVIKNFSEEIEV